MYHPYLQEQVAHAHYQLAWRPQGIATTIHDGENEHRRIVVAIPCGRHASSIHKP